MAKSPAPSIRVLLLTLVAAFGVSLWFMQDGTIAAEMTVSAEAGDCAAESCDGCGGGDDGGARSGACVAPCAAAAQVILPEEVPPSPSASRAGWQASHSSSNGRFPRPDHGPPKLLTFG